MKSTNILSELREFVVYQAAEDAVLPSSERKHQEKLVADVLGQEALSGKSLKELLALYRTERQAA
ncbi:hypothetical protein KW801_02745 [Candidatus Saccharibacteria bacterium]|nr:hypothetical protein [Candidatus Saccharibacteria bacterium]